MVSALAVALGHLYHLHDFEIPAKLAAGTLAAAHLLQVDSVKEGAIQSMSNSFTPKIINECYAMAVEVIEK